MSLQLCHHDELAPGIDRMTTGDGVPVQTVQLLYS